MRSVYMATLGCPKNVVDSRHLLDAFIAEGFVPVENPADSDIILVNTCGFIKDAKEESIGEILKLVGYKRRGGRKSRRVLVFGCLAQRYRDELLREIPEIDGLWGVGQEKEIIEYCKRTEARKIGSSKEQKHLQRTRPSFVYLKIAEGCDKKCTFCVIPSIRGKFRSTSHEAILDEARSYVGQGVRELILVAQDILNYGKEWKDYSLLDLLRDLSAIEGDFWIRLLYLYPTEINEELLDFIAGEEKICKYLDIPLQHSEDRMLRLMGRRGTRKEYVKLIRTIRRKIPGVALRTTFIVGFPSETEEDFRGLADFIEEMRFDRLGVFTFSKEEGTPSARLKEQVPEKIRKRRLDEIMRCQAAISLEKNLELVGKRFRAIIDELDDDVIIARLCSHAPEIDGVVIIDRSEERKEQKGLTAGTSGLQGFRSSEPGVGDFVEVEIIDAYDYDLKGKLL
jgi:ribosomal protein S12 methylthiotransferase